MKKYVIKQSRFTGRGSAEPRVNYIEGTVEELTKYFSYTLEVGYSYESKVNMHPKTIKSLISNLKKAYDIKEGSCYNRTLIELHEGPIPQKEVVNG